MMRDVQRDEPDESRANQPDAPLENSFQKNTEEDGGPADKSSG
jgi:hypothetical protein